MFYMVLYNNGFLNKNQKEFVGLLDAVKSEIYGEDIDFFFEDIKDISETIDRNSKRDLGVLKSPATNNKKNAETKEVLKAINKEAEKESGEGILSKQEIEDRLLKSKRESRKRVTIKSVNSIPAKRLSVLAQAKLKQNNPEGTVEKETVGSNTNKTETDKENLALNNLVEDNLLDNPDQIKILLDQDKENSMKIENTEQIKIFLANCVILIDRYKKEVRIKLLNENLKSLRNENLALKEVFSNSKSDLDVSLFRNKFSASLLKHLDDTHLVNINKMYFFFETFINKLLNASIEVETHSFTNAFIINRDELEVILAELIRDYVNFNSVLRKQENYNGAIEKYGNAFSVKKLTVFLNSTKQKLVDYEDNIEKITNAKLALNSNKLIFEMDNLYRQLKILKENVVVMEDYIQTYFHEKFFYITSKLKSEADEIENKFQIFKNEVKSNTIMNITDEYNNCLSELKQRTLFLTQQANTVKKPKQFNSEMALGLEPVTNNPSTALVNTKSNSNILGNENYNNNIEENVNEDSFFDHFYREIEIETNYNKDINIQRKKTERLNDQVNQLHLFYRMKIMNMQKKFNMEVDSLKQKLSSNQDLWEKLSVAEKNETILKEELAKTQRNLASNEEFIKKLQTQIKILHDKNVTIEKKLSAIAAHDIINSASQGENIKAKELYSETKSTYVYNLKNNVALINAKNVNNLKNNVALINAIEILKKGKMPEALLVCENLETLHLKYSQEVENKRLYINSLNAIKEDITNSREITKMKMHEANNLIERLQEEIKELKKENHRMKVKYMSEYEKGENTFILNQSKNSDTLTNKTGNSRKTQGQSPSIQDQVRTISSNMNNVITSKNSVKPDSFGGEGTTKSKNEKMSYLKNSAKMVIESSKGNTDTKGSNLGIFTANKKNTK
eukprot:CAMPEP_0170537150 /NCGR_PEP_ID=MMETSP0209-20121228/102547_1 /TAXON_ID=665100 ORGANISM="Litonotus pictus, Strain P1" /NCGR_SAMPLE_ID=MMETSP0209 /ASSEMBLY_ACC=CAM_ASM_000301 /LENGTH=905 /DNA_ID=CAMNT_0010838601 /DNA_START=611 /DNA_END=3326 /DNA_ORIENTATION=-